ncbi:Chitotriosidase-1 [Lasiodiplodia theobromae]|uniref:chitinase n=1 Tax=Lasiodiplodia theobromae TaxID=45133 RepID=A0A5N5CUJ4_9PEZI|nr:Chitotriosidase-1 [Lasiodiplodia theobromae]
MPNTSHDLFRDVAAIKKDNPDLKVLIALGGWGFNDNNTVTQPVFHNLVSKSSARKNFIANLLIFLRGYGFDGVDFDWEYPGASDRGGGEYDGENLALLLKELKQAIAKDPADYLVSFTAPTSYWYLRHFTHLAEYMDHVDWVNVMTYDLHGVWDSDSSIGSHVLAHTILTGIKEALNLFWRNDIDPAKVNLGLGFYGRSFQLADPSCNTPGCLFKGGGAPGECTGSSGTLSYREIMAIMDKEHVEPYHDTENAVKYLTWKDQWVSFDDIDTFQEKISFANSIGLGGLFIWALNHDTPDFDALQGVIHPKTLGSYGAEAEAADHWRNAPDGDCRVTDCGIEWYEEVFLPVPLDYLFPDPPPADEADSEFTLKLDSANNKDKSAAYNDDPDNGAFGFVVLTSPEEVQITLDKRDGSHWEFLDCFDGGEAEHTVRMTCTNDASDSNCHKIHLGRGVPGKILEMPGGCGPGRYAVAKSLEVSANQSLPQHLRKRGIESVVYDLTFDYNFHRVPRDLGKTQVRIDYSNQPGYWDGVVDKAATHQRKRDLSEHRNNHKRWLEEAWREDMHGGHLDHDELHKRWFGSNVLDWLKGILGGGFSGEVEFKYSYRDDFIVKLIEERYGPCNINGVEVSASLDVKAEAHVEVDTTYGFTLITTLDFPPDLSNSYLFFRNRGEATAKFTVDALATATFRSGGFEFLSADKFGAAFTVPGILTIGPNFKLLGSVDGEVSVSGNLQAQVKLADWDVRQTYPVASDEWSPEAEKEPSRSDMPCQDWLNFINGKDPKILSTDFFS